MLNFETEKIKYFKKIKNFNINKFDKETINFLTNIKTLQQLELSDLFISHHINIANLIDQAKQGNIDDIELENSAFLTFLDDCFKYKQEPNLYGLTYFNKYKENDYYLLIQSLYESYVLYAKEKNELADLLFEKYAVDIRNEFGLTLLETFKNECLIELFPEIYVYGDEYKNYLQTFNNYMNEKSYKPLIKIKK